MERNQWSGSLKDKALPASPATTFFPCGKKSSEAHVWVELAFWGQGQPIPFQQMKQECVAALPPIVDPLTSTITGMSSPECPPCQTQRELSRSARHCRLSEHLLRGMHGDSNRSGVAGRVPPLPFLLSEASASHCLIGGPALL